MRVIRSYRFVFFVASVALVVSALPGATQPAFAAPAGTLTVSDSGTDDLPAPTDGVFDIQTDIVVDPADIESALELGSGGVTLWATSITVQSDIDGPNTNSLTLKASANITVQPGVSVTNQGGDVIFWSDSDSNSVGYILLGTLASSSSCAIDSGGGDIVLGGRADPYTEFASGGASVPVPTQPIFGVGIWGCSLDAGGGDISIRASTGTSNDSVRAVLLGAQSQAPFNRTTINTSGSGSVVIFGDASQSASGTNPWGPTGSADITTGSGDVSIIGKSDNASGSNRRGAVFSGFNIVSTSGNVLFQDQTPGANSTNSGWYFGGGASSVSTTGSITVETDKFLSDASLTVSTGSFSVVPYTDSSFDNNPSLGNVTATNASSVTFGREGNTSNVTINNALTVGGSLTLHGSDVTLGAATSASTVNIYASGTASQSAGLTATSLGLHGAGTYTLTNTSNEIGTLAAGSGGSKVAALSVYDASGGLTVGQVGSLEGVSAVGDVLVETGTGDITLAKSIDTDSTTTTAITVNAGKTSAAETGSGGDIVVSGSPTLTAGSGAIVRMFSGSEAASTGLTALVGGSTKVYRGVDETSSLSPALTNGSKYALYRSTTASSSTSASTSGGSSGAPAVESPPPVTTRATPRPSDVGPVEPNIEPVSRPVERLGLVFDPDAPSRATVGGSLANLVGTPLGSDRLNFSTVGFEFGLTFDPAVGALVQTDTPSGSPELLVPRSQFAAMSGQAYPGSFVQLWLPGTSTDFRELARIPVRSDGRFASEVSFGPGSLEAPMRIGRQVLQVVGYDKQGNQTVIDMTINIGQGPPAPELNRQAGELPDLSAGESLATSAGIPQDVTVTGMPEAAGVVVEGAGWVIGVNANPENGAVENTESGVLMRLSPSSTATWNVSGFMPGTLATVWLFSEPTLLTTVTIDENGDCSSEFLVDGRLIAPGEHTLQVQGVGADGFIKAANLGVVVEEPVELTADSASNLLWWVLGLILLALVLFVFLASSRRRRA